MFWRRKRSRDNLIWEKFRVSWVGEEEGVGIEVGLRFWSFFCRRCSSMVIDILEVFRMRVEVLGFRISYRDLFIMIYD